VCGSRISVCWPPQPNQRAKNQAFLIEPEFFYYLGSFEVTHIAYRPLRTNSQKEVRKTREVALKVRPFARYLLCSRPQLNQGINGVQKRIVQVT